MTAGAFKQADVTRALRGAKAAGLEVTRIEIGRDGKIVLSAGKTSEPEQLTPLDKFRIERSRLENGQG